MIRIVVFLVFIFAVIDARADLIIQNQTIYPATTNQVEIKMRKDAPSFARQVVTPAATNDVTTKIKGNKIRTDHTGDSAGDRSSIIDLKTFEATILEHQKKEAVKKNAEQLKHWATNMTTVAVEPPKLRDTGKSEKLMGYDAEIYTWTNADGMAGAWWVAKKFPDFSKIKKDLAKLDELRADEVGKGSEPDQSTAPGVVLKVQLVQSGQTFTILTTSITEEPIADTTFEIPKDYLVVTSP